MTEITAVDLINLPYAEYDLDATYDEQLAPLVTALLEKARELGFPLMLAVAIRQDREGNWTLAQSCQMSDPARTPIQLQAANLRLDDKGDIADKLEMIGALRSAKTQSRLKAAH